MMKELPPAMFDDPVMLRIYSEFLEMPCLRLTAAQAQRLFGIGAQHCARMLDDLVARSFLARRPDGLYVRSTEGHLGSALRGPSATHLKRTA